MTPGLDWRALEAALYAIRAISKEAPHLAMKISYHYSCRLRICPTILNCSMATLTASAYSEWYVRQLSISSIVICIVAL